MKEPRRLSMSVLLPLLLLMSSASLSGNKLIYVFVVTDSLKSVCLQGGLNMDD